MLGAMKNDLPKLRWFQYRLRTLLIFVTLCALPLSWLGWKVREAEAAAAIVRLGGQVVWDHEEAGPEWLRSFLVETFFRHLTYVVLTKYEVMDSTLEPLTALHHPYFL